MKVGDYSLRSAYAPHTPSRADLQRPDGESAARSTDPRRDATFDRVEVSPLAEMLSTVLAIDGAERAARIQRLAEAVQADRYEVDAKALARTLLREAAEPSGVGAAE